MIDLFDVVAARDGLSCVWSGTVSRETGRSRGDLVLMRRNEDYGDALSNLILMQSIHADSVRGYLGSIGYVRGYVTGDNPVRVPFFHRASREWRWLDNDGNISLRKRMLNNDESPTRFTEPKLRLR